VTDTAPFSLNLPPVEVRGESSPYTGAEPVTPDVPPVPGVGTPQQGQDPFEGLHLDANDPWAQQFVQELGPAFARFGGGDGAAPAAPTAAMPAAPADAPPAQGGDGAGAVPPAASAPTTADGTTPWGLPADTIPSDERAADPTSAALDAPDGSYTPPGPATVTIAGQAFHEADVQRALQSAAYLDSLPAPLVDAFNAVIRGEANIVPAGAATATAPAGTYTPPAAAAPSASQAPAHLAPLPSRDQFLDPAAYDAAVAQHQALEGLLAQNASLQQQVASVAPAVQSLAQQQQLEAQRRYDDELRTRQQIVNAEAASFMQSNGLSHAEMDALYLATQQSGIAHHLATRHADPHALYRAAFEHTYWTDPTFRERALSRSLEGERADDEATRNRKAKAAALAGSAPGSVPRVAPAPNVRSMTQPQRLQAMAAEIARAQGGA
jgi:hypothetical protein